MNDLGLEPIPSLRVTNPHYRSSAPMRFPLKNVQITSTVKLEALQASPQKRKRAVKEKETADAVKKRKVSAEENYTEM